MNSFLSLFRIFGLDFKRLFCAIKGLPFYLFDFIRLKKQKKEDNSFVFGKPYPQLIEWHDPRNLDTIFHIKRLGINI